MSNEIQNPVPESHPGEPTVLDLFKSVTKDWPSFIRFLRSLGNTEQRAAIERAAAEQARLLAESELVPPPEEPGSRVFPWRSVMALLLALLAQYLLEPPKPNVELGLAIYFFAAGLAAWALVKDEWRFTPLRPEVPRSDPLTVRSIPLLISIVSALTAFLMFTDNLFSWANVSMWLLAIAAFVWAFWLPGPGRLPNAEDPSARRRQALWMALLIAVFGLMIFFRFNRIDSIPAEPFSDHAEKIFDVYDITQGQTHIFFPRNTGREGFQMYWTLLVAALFGTGLSFLSLKIGTALLGLLTLPYIYLLGKELGSPRLGLLAMFLFGIAYWPNVVARIGLRFPLYPLFAAPVLFYLLRGLRTRSRNDFILCGLFIGLGLHGYSPFRIMPFVVVVAFGLYWLFQRSPEERRQSAGWLVLVGVAALLVFLPLMRYALEDPDYFSFRAMTRLSDIQRPLPGPVWQVFFSNLWNALRMFHWDDGEIWVNSLPHRPALDVVTGALLLLGLVLLAGRFIRRRDWRDLFLLLLIPLMLMPSVLSLAYPGENPALNRAGGAAVPAILIAALALDGLLTGLAGPSEGRRAERVASSPKGEASGKMRTWLAWGLTGVLLAASAYQNYDLVFRQFDTHFRIRALNTSEMGKVISDFRADHGRTDTVWIVPFPYWVDTRLPGVWAGIPNRDFAVFRENLPSTLSAPYPKLFIFWQEDVETEQALRQLYPNGELSRYTSAVDPTKDFMLYFVER